MASGSELDLLDHSQPHALYGSKESHVPSHELYIGHLRAAESRDVVFGRTSGRPWLTHLVRVA